MTFQDISTVKNVFARVGMSHLTSSIGAPYSQRMRALTGIEINTSFQPNSNPHFGTITTLMCVAAIAQQLMNEFQKPASVTIDVLENAPDRKIHPIKKINHDGQDIEYFLSLKDSLMENGSTVGEHNMLTYNHLLKFLQNKTTLPFRTRSYESCQANSYFRRAILNIFNQREQFLPIIAPEGNEFKLRFPCPKCKWVDKVGINTSVASLSQKRIDFQAYCPDHGKHFATLTEDSPDFFDTNTPLRDIARVPRLIEDGISNRLLPLMVDGRDWSGRWDRCVHINGLSILGYSIRDLPVRIYTPTVTDMLGAKLSKSLYVKNVGKYIPKGFTDYNSFINEFGDEGLSILWDHIKEWATDPAFIDRDSYTILYFSLLLEGKLEKAEIKG